MSGQEAKEDQHFQSRSSGYHSQNIQNPHSQGSVHDNSQIFTPNLEHKEPWRNFEKIIEDTIKQTFKQDIHLVMDAIITQAVNDTITKNLKTIPTCSCQWATFALGKGKRPNFTNSPGGECPHADYTGLKINDEDLKEFIKDRTALPHLKGLTLNENELTDDCIDNLCKMLSFMPHLKNVEIIDNRFTSEGIKNLVFKLGKIEWGGDFLLSTGSYKGGGKNYKFNNRERTKSESWKPKSKPKDGH